MISIVYFLAGESVATPSPELLARGQVADVAAVRGGSCDRSVARRICREVDKHFLAALQHIGLCVSEVLCLSRARSNWFAAMGDEDLRLHVAAEQGGSVGGGGVVGFLDRLGRGSMSIRIILDDRGWCPFVAAQCRREAISAAVGSALGDAGAPWLCVGLSEVLNEELGGGADSVLRTELNAVVREADASTLFQMMLRLDDVAEFSEGPWRVLAWAAVRLLWDASAKFTRRIARQVGYFQSRVIDPGEAGALQEDIEDMLCQILKKNDANLNFLVSSWASYAEMGEVSSGVLNREAFYKRLRRLVLDARFGVSFRDVIDEFKVKGAHLVEHAVVWILPWDSQMKFWAGKHGIGDVLRIENGRLSGRGMLSSHATWKWSAQPSGKRGLDVLKPGLRVKCAVKVRLFVGESAFFCLTVRSSRGVGYAFIAEAGR